MLPVSKHKPKAKTACSAVSVTFATALIFLVLFLYRRQHQLAIANYSGGINHGSGEKVALLQERESLIRKATAEFEAWNQAAAQADIDVKHLGLSISAPSSYTPLSETSLQATSTSPPPIQAGRTTLPPNWKTRDQLRFEHPQLVEAVEKFAVNNEILLVLCNAVMLCQNTTLCWWNGGNILGLFLDVMQRHGITNYVIGVLDDESQDYCESRNANWFRPNKTTPESLKHTRDANRISAMKYLLLEDLIQLGVNTLVSDMDVVYVQNPFEHLYRDADVEIQTDGFDEQGAYGDFLSVNDTSMGWGSTGVFRWQFTMNVGCAYIRSSPRTLNLVQRVSDNLAHTGQWDQMVFNKLLLSLSYDNFTSSYASVRVMDFLLWVNSKTYFKSQREHFIPGKKSVAEVPVMVHMNYHPDKHRRMVCVMERYFQGKVDACDGFPGGSEPGS